MTSATLQKIRAKMTTGTYQSASTEDLVDVPVALFPPAVVNAAAKALGEKALSDYFIGIYDHSYRAQAAGSGINRNQLQGVLLSHKKIQKWLTAQGINDIANTGDPKIMRIYLEEHLNNIRQAVKVFEEIAQQLGD